MQPRKLTTRHGYVRLNAQVRPSRRNWFRRICRSSLPFIGISAVSAYLGASSAFLPAPSVVKSSMQSQHSSRPLETLPALGVLAASLAGSTKVLSEGLPELTPDTFRPVCPASDGIYGFGKAAADAFLGAEGAEYRPLAIEALLRVRLEICVLESFVYEAIIPFVQRKGLGWILPLHETIDTVIAGTVFAIAVNFILFGTTKILAVIGIYHDFLIGAPLRLIGYGILPETKPKEVPLIQINWPGAPAPKEENEEIESEPKEPPAAPLAVFGMVCKGYGVFAGIVKDFLEGLDTFVGRYLAFFSITYILFKWAHFRLFNDFPPF
eukprot:TRINITY_DN15351_c1_g1_i1.p1 TRINITY_DN15351_c1_g1~~TRINITY_DN15351_c1_g1_i1.p1  ORF type:complete len:347 (-),score=49.92 TRINITY_DN15351_c1_g1_i1:38-1006(-)